MTVEGDPVWVRGDPGREDGEAVLRVQDTGEGIRADLLPRVFDPFVQEPQSLDRARGGLGLGRTLVKRLVELHGGAIAVTRAGPGLGSVFTVRLPVAFDNGGGAVAAAVPPADSTRSRRVLIVEDNAGARESLRLLLTLAGHRVDAVADASSALDRLERSIPTWR